MIPVMMIWMMMIVIRIMVMMRMMDDGHDENFGNGEGFDDDFVQF